MAVGARASPVCSRGRTEVRGHPRFPAGRARSRGERAEARGPVPRDAEPARPTGFETYIMLSWSFAASDIMAGVQGGSQTTSTFAWVTPGTEETLAWTSGGRDPATGQAGDVRVIWMVTAPAASTSTL